MIFTKRLSPPTAGRDERTEKAKKKNPYTRRNETTDRYCGSDVRDFSDFHSKRMFNVIICDINYAVQD